MNTAYSLFTGLPIVLQGLAQAQQPSLSATAAPAYPAQTIFDDEPTRVDLRLPVRPDPSRLDTEIVRELLDYEKLGTTLAEIMRFERWLNEHRLGVCFFTKAVEYLVRMRREDPDQEITHIRRIR